MNKGNIRAIDAALALLFAAVMIAVPAAAAWGTSVDVASLPSSASARCSYEMGCWDETWFPGQTFTDIQVADVTPATLAQYDTVFMYATNPNPLSAQQKADLLSWVDAGGKLVLCPGEDIAYGPAWDYSWLPEAVTLSTPGAMGAPGTLTIAEDSVLTQDGSGNPIDVNDLGFYTDAVGDADVLTVLSSGWCAALIATNYNQVTGPAEMYDLYGNGIIIFNGLDWDYLGFNANLRQAMKNMFDVDYLSCGVPWDGNLEVTKASDKPLYMVGETITFTVTVTNPQPVDATNVMWTDNPPAEISMGTISGPLANIPAGGSLPPFTITATAVTGGTGLVNEVLITGDGPGGNKFSGVAHVTFDIQSNQPPVADAGPDQTVSHPSMVYLDGSGSYDPDLDPITYAWAITQVPAGSGAFLSDPAVVNPTFTTDKPGFYRIQLVVNDGQLDSAPDEVVIEATNEPPQVIDAEPSIACLWPPSNKLVPVTIMDVNDPNGDQFTITIDGITSDEATATEPGAAGPKFAPDALVIKTTGSDDSAQLRSERSGTKDGRVYQVSFTATDLFGASSSGILQVRVPHDWSEPCVATDSGQAYDATGIN
jgi:uncharacterized repeat protein (TIGR01451 family)